MRRDRQSKKSLFRAGHRIASQHQVVAAIVSGVDQSFAFALMVADPSIGFAAGVDCSGPRRTGATLVSVVAWKKALARNAPTCR
jgi:hypothetical protein